MRAPTIHLLAIPLLAGALLAGPAAAQTRAEVSAHARAQFAAADRDRDGTLTRDEVARRLTQVPAGRGLSVGRSRILTNQYFGRLDLNRDGRVTRRELDGAVANGFGRFDRNRDGRIGPRERAAAQAFIRNPAR